MQDLPRKIEEQKRREEEAIHKRAALTVTNDVFGRKRVDKRHTKIHANTQDRRMTLPEQRAMRLQVLALCGLLALILIMLWKSIH